MRKHSTLPTTVGKVAEDIATDYLSGQGFKLVRRNFNCRYGELDIIGFDKQLLVFVEVRYRKNENILAAVETIDRHKRKKLITTSSYYLNGQKKFQSYQCRYDVIIITGELETPVIKWIKNAFQA